MRQFTAVFFLVLLCGLLANSIQAQNEALQPGVAVERALARGQHHNFTVSLEADQFLQLVVTQRGIDVIIQAFGPDEKSLGEFDSPNGTEGAEPVSIVSTAAGVYRVDLTPLKQDENLPAGRYEIKIVEIRKATDQELLARKSPELLKARGLALLTEAADNVPQLRLPQSRVRAQLQIAQLLQPSDEKQAAKVAADAAEGVKEYIANADALDEDYYQVWELAMQLRGEVVQVLGQSDPDAALAFLRATRGMSGPPQYRSQWDRELQIELSLAGQLSTKDPKRAVQLGEESLKRGFSNALLDLVGRLRVNEPELAAKLARQIAAKLQEQKLLQNQEAANVAVNLLRLAHSPPRRYQGMRSTPPVGKTDSPLLSDQEYKDLFDKALNEALAYKPLAGGYYSQEKNSAQNILNSLKSMPKEMEGYAAVKMEQVDKRVVELNSSGDPNNMRWEKYQQSINAGTVEESLESAGRAPVEMRDQLYQQVAQRAVSLGDVPRARQIVKDNVQNPAMRQQALSQIEQQAIYFDAQKGRIDEALRGVANLRTSKERAMMISQLANQIGPGQKRAAALEMLEQARNLIGSPQRVENQEQMNALIEIARVISRYDSKRAFEIIEPLLDQFNEMTAAAFVLNGFGQQYYQDGELSLQNGSNMANIAVQLNQSLGTLGRANFDRAKAGAERLQRPELRIYAYLAIAQQAISGDPNDRRFGFVRMGR